MRFQIKQGTKVLTDKVVASGYDMLLGQGRGGEVSIASFLPNENGGTVCVLSLINKTANPVSVVYEGKTHMVEAGQRFGPFYYSGTFHLDDMVVEKVPVS